MQTIIKRRLTTKLVESCWRSIFVIIFLWRDDVIQNGWQELDPLLRLRTVFGVRELLAIRNSNFFNVVLIHVKPIKCYLEQSWESASKSISSRNISLLAQDILSYFDRQIWWRSKFSVYHGSINVVIDSDICIDVDQLIQFIIRIWRYWPLWHSLRNELYNKYNGT